jgi:catechol 2,3-dioxygenase-like lactoylglutathione lyase family enzyme
MNVRIRQVAHTGVTVTNVERSIEFWHGALRFDVRFHADAHATFAETATGVPGAELRIATVGGYGHNIELGEYVALDGRQVLKPRPCDVGSWHVALMVDDIEDVFHALPAHGFDAANPPAVIESGPRSKKRGYSGVCSPSRRNDRRTDPAPCGPSAPRGFCGSK